MQREIPGVLWIGLIVLGLITVIQFLMAIVHVNLVLLVGVAISVLLLVGLYRGQRWAFVVTLVLGVLGIVVALARNPGVGLFVLVGNGFVLVPVYLAKDYFWGPRLAAQGGGANYCHRCGHDLRGAVQPSCPNCGAEIRTTDRGPMD